MYHRLIEDYLTHYQPALKAELMSQQALPAYLESQAQTMLTAKQRLVDQLQASESQMSQLQRELEADQTVREMFLPIP